MAGRRRGRLLSSNSDIPRSDLHDSRIHHSGEGWLHGVAYAKLNLFLEVLARRPDGFHELESVFVEVDVADELKVRWSTGLPEGLPTVESSPPIGPPSATRRASHTSKASDSLQVEGRPIDGPAEDNLILRAIRAYREVVPELPAVEVKLHKKIPMGAGMGGGSADAAFLLAALDHLRGRHLPADTQHAIAAQLGSDVPFFLNGNAAVCRGRGEEIEAIEDLPKRVFAIVKPDASLATARVYSLLRLTANRRDVQSFAQSLRADSGGDPECFNRLESAAFALAPELRQLRDRLVKRSGSLWTMTGSGSALFALASSHEEGRGILQRVAPVHSGEGFLAESCPRLSTRH